MPVMHDHHPAKTGPLASLLRPFRHSNYRLFFTGQAISLIGTWMQSVALSWLVYRITGSGLHLGLMGFASQFPVFLLSLFGGALADRMDRRRLLMATQVAAMLQAALLAALVLSGTAQLWHLYALAVLLGLANAVDMPTRQSFVMEIVDASDLANAIGMNSTMFNAARVVGPSLAGLLVAAVGEGWCFLLNAVSFVGVILCLARMRLEPRPAQESAPPVLRGIGEVLAYAAADRFIRSVLLLLSVGSLLGVPFMVLMPMMADQVLGHGAGGYGMLMGAAGVGCLAAALTLAARGGNAGLDRHVLLAAMGFGVFLVLFSLSGTFWLSMLLLAPTGYCMILFMAGCNVLMQLNTPSRMRGRIMSLFVVTLIGMAPFGSLLAGWAARHMGAPATITASGFCCMAAALAFGRGLTAGLGETQGKNGS